MSIETLKEMIRERLHSLKRVEDNTHKLLAEINNLTVDLPVDQTERSIQLSGRLRMFAKRLDDLSFQAERISSELATLRMIENQMS